MKKLLVLTVGLLFVMPLAASAQDEITDTLDVYLSASDPVDTVLGDAPWVGPFTPGEPIADPVATIGPGGYIFIGFPNGFRWVNMKTLWIHIEGGANLTLEGAVSYNSGGQYGTIEIVEEVIVGADLDILIRIFPQPDWEVIVLHNATAGPVPIVSVWAVSRCVTIPATTTYGLAVLALLLIGSTVWILRRKKAGAIA
jgi:hypothetical protein